MKRWWLASFGLGLSLVAGAGSVGAARFAVDTTADSPAASVGDGKCESKAGGCTLRAAVEEANASTLPAEIEIPAGTYKISTAPGGPDMAQSGTLFVRGELRISGTGRDGTILDGGGKGRIFEVGENADLTVSDLTIEKGLASGGDGGGILNLGQLTLRGVTLRNHRAKSDPLVADGRGAALANRSRAKLEDVRIENNTADGRGGGIYNGENASLEALNSTIRGNASQTDLGGGICNEGNVKLVISTVAQNRATDGGGIATPSGQILLLDSTVSSNQAGTDGGGLLNAGTLTATDLTLSGNSAGGRGGGLFNRGDGRVVLNNVTIAQNKASGGGGLANKAGTVEVSNSILASNAASPEAAPDCSGTILSGGYNLIENAAGCQIGGQSTGNVIGTRAKLAALATNQGPTHTHALERGSPAIDAGNPATPTGIGGTCAPADQRGVKRPQDGTGSGQAACDIGAYELEP